VYRLNFPRLFEQQWHSVHVTKTFILLRTLGREGKWKGQGSDQAIKAYQSAVIYVSSVLSQSQSPTRGHCIVEMHRTCPLQCSAEAEYFSAQAERVPKFGRTSAEYFFSTTSLRMTNNFGASLLW